MIKIYSKSLSIQKSLYALVLSNSLLHIDKTVFFLKILRIKISYVQRKIHSTKKS